MPHQKVLFSRVWYFCMKNWNTAPYNLANYVFFSVFCLFCFLLSKNTLRVMFYTYVCYWNTFQYKYIQITFHVVKQYDARVTSKYFCLLFMIIVYLPVSIFVYLPIYLAWMNFPVDLFRKIDNLSKMCNFDDSCKKPLRILRNISHSPSQIYAKILSRT